MAALSPAVAAALAAAAAGAVTTQAIPPAHAGADVVRDRRRYMAAAGAALGVGGALGIASRSAAPVVVAGAAVAAVIALREYLIHA